MYGSDQSASLEKGLTDLVDIVRKIPNLIGTEDKKFLNAKFLLQKN